MKLTVKVDDRSFEVEVGDLHARPIAAIVDGDLFEVWPEATLDLPPAPIKSATPRSISEPIKPFPSNGKQTNAVYAPIPGVIISIAVQLGTTVERGQELCILEAMKMKNTVRASRDGIIALINISIGQHVKHHDVLMEFEQ